MPKLNTRLEVDRCPHCNIHTPNISQRTNLETTASNNGKKRMWIIYVCASCGGVVTACSSALKQEITEMYPRKMSVDNAIPEKAGEFLRQAQESLHAPAGSIMLCASCVDEMLKQKGLTEGSLYRRIEDAVQNNLITEDMSTWAHEVRLDANDQRHADEGSTLPTEEGAKKCVMFASTLGHILFVLPARVQRGLSDASN